MEALCQQKCPGFTPKASTSATCTKGLHRTGRTTTSTAIDVLKFSGCSNTKSNKVLNTSDLKPTHPHRRLHSHPVLRPSLSDPNIASEEGGGGPSGARSGARRGSSALGTYSNVGCRINAAFSMQQLQQLFRIYGFLGFGGLRLLGHVRFAGFTELMRLV